MRRLRVALAIAVPAAFLAGCSQIEALAPVGGTAITTVRIATYDVLIDQQIPILVAPQCAATSSGFTCEGTTVDGAPITAQAGPSSPFDLVISVDGEVVFEGTAQEVIDAAVLESS